MGHCGQAGCSDCQHFGDELPQCDRKRDSLSFQGTMAFYSSSTCFVLLYTLIKANNRLGCISGCEFSTEFDLKPDLSHFQDWNLFTEPSDFFKVLSQVESRLVNMHYCVVTVHLKLYWVLWFKSAVLNSSARTTQPPHPTSSRTFCMFLLSLLTFVIF